MELILFIFRLRKKIFYSLVKVKKNTIVTFQCETLAQICVATQITEGKVYVHGGNRKIVQRKNGDLRSNR